MSSIHDRLFILADERDAARFDAHLLRQEKEKLRQENELLREALRLAVVEMAAMDCLDERASRALLKAHEALDGTKDKP